MSQPGKFDRAVDLLKRQSRGCFRAAKNPRYKESRANAMRSLGHEYADAARALEEIGVLSKVRQEVAR